MAHQVSITFILPSADQVLRQSLLRAGALMTSLSFVKKGIFALLALLLALQASFGCGMAQADAAIKAPCCGANCPVPSSAGDGACCQVQNSSAAAEAVSAKPNVATLQPFAGSIQAYEVTPVITRFELASAFQANPPGAAKLALLCSRQI